MPWIDIAEALKPETLEFIGTRHVFTFEKAGVRTNYKVMRIDKKRGKVWTKIIPLYTPEEFGALYAARNRTKK